MDYGFSLSIIKVISEGLTAGFGILGLLTEFKTDVVLPNGSKIKRVTRWGWVALTGIVVTLPDERRGPLRFDGSAQATH